MRVASERSSASPSGCQILRRNPNIRPIVPIGRPCSVSRRSIQPAHPAQIGLSFGHSRERTVMKLSSTLGLGFVLLWGTLGCVHDNRPVDSSPTPVNPTPPPAASTTPSDPVQTDATKRPLPSSKYRGKPRSQAGGSTEGTSTADPNASSTGVGGTTDSPPANAGTGGLSGTGGITSVEGAAAVLSTIPGAAAVVQSLGTGGTSQGQ